MTKTPEYRAWQQMKNRCNNQADPKYPHWGGRGIAVCKEWESSFVAFYEHIGPKPGESYSVDRIDNDGNYEPGNVRWATKKEQAANRRKTKLSGRVLRGDNKAGITGVRYRKEHGTWRAHLFVGGNKKNLGTHYSLLDACCARKSAEIKFDKLRNRAN